MVLLTLIPGLTIFVITLLVGILAYTFKKTLRSLSKKKRKKRNPAFKLVLLPVVIMFAICVSFFFFDDFWMMSYYTLLQDTEPANKNGTYNGGVGGGTYGGGGTEGTSRTLTGTNLMLMNQLTGGYCADWLVLARDHCNRKYLPDDVKFPNNVNPSIVLMTGTAMKETGLTTITLTGGEKAKVPKCSFNLSKAAYGETVDGCTYDLYNVSSFWLTNHKDYVSESFETSLRSASSGYYGTFQMKYSMLPRNPDYPDRTYTTDDEGKKLTGNFPSTLNGYGMETGRGTDKGDFGFFPDQMASNLQSCWSRWAINYKNLGGKYIDFSKYSMSGIGYAATNAGEGNVANWYGLSARGSANCASKEAYPKGEERGACVADAMNQLVNSYEKIQEYVLTHPDVMNEGLYLDRQTFHGMMVTATLYGCKGGMLTSTNRDKIIKRFGSNNFVTGMLIGYRGVTGKTSATVEEVKALITNFDCSEADAAKANTGAYGFIDSKNDAYGGSGNFGVHFKDSSRTFTYNGQTLPVLHMADVEPTSGIFWIPMGGAYLYWKMLVYSGVECTFMDAYQDVLTGSITIVEEAEKIADTPRYAQNGSIASAMVSISYEDKVVARKDFADQWAKQSGKGDGRVKMAPYGVVCGTPLYIKIHAGVLPGDKYWASCDRGVCTAVRWSGHDDKFPAGACYGQMNYMVSSPKWQEIAYTGKEAECQAGDVMIRSDTWLAEHRRVPNSSTTGHIVMYCGHEEIMKRFPNQTKAVIAASSYGDRPPVIDPWYEGNKGLQTYNVFRSIYTEADSRYKNITADSIT